ncbi:MAG: hypothetical protein ACFCU1_02065 [Sumerlaeia bacterium]
MNFSPPEILLITTGLALVVGGWILYRTVINVVGGVFGAGLGIATGWSLSQFLNLDDPYPLILQVAFAVIQAFMGAYIFRRLDRWAFFIFGLVLGFAVVIAQYVMHKETLLSLGVEAPYLYAGLAVVGALLGLIFFLVRNMLIILASCALGTLLLFQGLQNFYGGVPALLAFPLGFMIQYRIVNPSKKKPKDD